MQYQELTINVAGFVGGQARQYLAALIDEYNLDIERAFFHYADPVPGHETAAPHAVSSGPAPIRIHGNRRNIRIVAIGEEGAKLLRMYSPMLMEAICRKDGVFPKYSTRSGDLCVKDIGHPFNYLLGQFVMNVPKASRAAVLGELKETTNFKNISGLTTNVISVGVGRAFAQRCAELQVESPNLNKVEIERTFAVHVRGRRAMLGIRAKVQVSAELIGPWQIGALQARGYGGISSIRRGVTSSKPS